MTYANITKKHLKKQTYANITKKYIPKQNEFQKTIQKLEESNKKDKKKRKRNRRTKKKKIKIDYRKSRKQKGKKYYKLDKELNKKKNNLRIIFISGHGNINLQDKIVKTELYPRIDMSQYQPNKKNTKLNDFYILKMGGIMDTIYNSDLYYLLSLLIKKTNKPRKDYMTYEKLVYEFQNKFFNFTNQYNEVEIFDLFNKLRDSYSDLKSQYSHDVNYNFRFYPKYIEEYKNLKEKYPSDDNIGFYPNNLLNNNIQECMGIYDLTLDYKGDKSIKNMFDPLYRKLKTLNMNIKPYKTVEGDDLIKRKYIHQTNLYESLLLFDYNKKYKEVLKKNKIIDYNYYKEYTKFNRRVMDRIEDSIEQDKILEREKQINVDLYQNIQFNTSDIIELIYDTIIETEYNDDEIAFHKDMKDNNKKILIIDGTCKGIPNINSNTMEEDYKNKIKYYRRQSIDPRIKDKFAFNNTHIKDDKVYVNKKKILKELFEGLDTELKGRFRNNLLYELDNKNKEDLKECIEKIYINIEKTGKPSGEFRNTDTSNNLKKKNIMMMKELFKTNNTNNTNNTVNENNTNNYNNTEFD